MKCIRIAIITVFIAGGIIALLQQDKTDSVPDYSLVLLEARKGAESVNTFAFDFYQVLAQNESGNIFFSPQNISAAFAILYMGAEGATKQEIRDVFHYGDGVHSEMSSLQNILNRTSPETAVIEVANALWPDEKLVLFNSYVNLVEKYHDTKITRLDYKNNPIQAVALINKWSEEKTKGRIRNVIDRLSAETRLVLTSSIYFKSEWMFEFPLENTKNGIFYKDNNNESNVDLMHRQDPHLFYYETELFKVVRLPYKNDAYSMLVVLPSKQGNLEIVEKSISIDIFKEILRSLSRTEVILYIPKFRFELKYELSGPLSTMGLTHPFSNSAEFSGLTKEFLKIDKVLHQVFIEIDEKQTEAAAVTSIVKLPTSGGGLKRPEPKIFRADHPFLYFILENQSDAILFAGRYAVPIPVSE